MKILLTGFFGEGNLGDETILQAICQNLPADCRCLVTSGRSTQPRAQAIRRRGIWSWPAYIEAISRSNAAIFSGGILQDWSFEGVTFFALRIIAASIAGCSPALWGAGIGPLRSSGTRLIARRALRRVETAWLRDEASVNDFKDLTGRDASYGADWSWFFPVPRRRQSRENGPMALNLRPWASGDWKSHVAHQLRHNERHIIGLSARSSDIKILKELAPKAAVVQPETFSDFAEACHNVSFGLAMRYHAALAMIRAGVPIKLIAYDSKVSDLAISAGVLTLQQNQVSDFRSARDEFFVENGQRFAAMHTAFGQFIQRITV